jgi:hypothetical protein
MTNHLDSAAASPLPTFATLRFGIELEVTGIDIPNCARVVASVVGGRVTVEGTYYNRHTVAMADGRKWTAMSDGSISDETGRGGAELVSPILTWADMPLVQDIARALVSAGAVVNSSCGMHVHVDAAAHKANPAALKALIVLAGSYEAVYTKGLGISSDRMANEFCKPINPSVVASAKKMTSVTLDKLASAWYTRVNGARGSVTSSMREHYNESRYHGLNVHAVWNKGTVEFRYFAGTLNDLTIRDNVAFCLGMMIYSLTRPETKGSRKAYTRDDVTAKNWASVLDGFGIKAGNPHLPEAGDIRRRLMSNVPAPVRAASPARLRLVQAA